MTRLHMPHPHIAHAFAEAFQHAAEHLRHAEPVPDQRLIPPAGDWDEWHYPDSSGYVEVQQ